MFVGINFFRAWQKRHVLARTSQLAGLTMHQMYKKSKDGLYKRQAWLLNKNNQSFLMFCLIQKRFVHPTSTKVSDQLTRMTKH